jgi:hypothetical protein
MRMSQEHSPNKEKSRPNGFSVEFYQTCKEELAPISLNLSHERVKERTLPN